MYYASILIKKSKIEDSEDLMEISRIIGPLIEKTVTDIFVSQRQALLTEPTTYIVPAIWGTKLE